MATTASMTNRPRRRPVRRHGRRGPATAVGPVRAAAAAPDGLRRTSGAGRHCGTWPSGRRAWSASTAAATAGSCRCPIRTWAGSRTPRTRCGVRCSSSRPGGARARPPAHPGRAAVRAGRQRRVDAGGRRPVPHGAGRPRAHPQLDLARAPQPGNRADDLVRRAGRPARPQPRRGVLRPGGEELASPALASRSEGLYGGAGLLPASEGGHGRGPGPGRPSRLLAYRWAATDATLSRLIESTGRRAASVRYSDPATGRDIMPTLRAELHRVLAGHRTPTTRTARQRDLGGLPRVGGDRGRRAPLPWTAGDMLVTPSWAAVDHEAADDADLFLLSDGPVLEALGLARTRQLPRQDVREDVA